jgi:hypothetical protein
MDGAVIIADSCPPELLAGPIKCNKCAFSVGSLCMVMGKLAAGMGVITGAAAKWNENNGLASNPAGSDSMVVSLNARSSVGDPLNGQRSFGLARGATHCI